MANTTTVPFIQDRKRLKKLISELDALRESVDAAGQEGQITDADMMAMEINQAATAVQTIRNFTD